MNNKMKLTGLILAGYVLGRTKKLGLALTVASAVAGTTAAKNRDQLLGGLKDFADSSPELKSLQEKITGRLADSGKSAAKAMAAKGVDQLSVKLQEQTEKMKSTLDDAADSLDPAVDDSEGSEDEDSETQEDEGSQAPEDESTSETEADPEPQEQTDESQAEEEAPKKPAAKRSSTAGRSSKGTRSSKSSTASRGSRTKSGAKRSTTSKKSSTSRSTAKPEETGDE